ncbi:MAG: Fur family transcriptional regulator [Anaerolineales bacterium]|jgi:Fur family ferric uptake transcriptional regulator
MGDLVQEAHVRLHAQGGRMTAQRRLLLTILESLREHPTAEELFLLAIKQDPSLNLSTVYRTLRWLEGENLVSARIFAEERRQERFDAALPSEHHHFMCTRCKNVIEFDSELFGSIKSQFQELNGASVATGSIVLYGLCSNCRKEDFDIDNYLGAK